MFPNTNEQLAAWTKPGEDMFKFWISMFPVAPLFGVAWRFDPATPAAVKPEPAPKPKPAPKAKAKAAPKAKAEPKPEAVQQAAIEAAEAASAKAADAVDALAAVAADAQSAMEDVAKSASPDFVMDKAPAKPDDLKLIKGVGPSLERQLNDLGVYTFAQIAAFTEKDLTWVDENLTAFKGRCFRDDWVGQARAKLN